MSMSSSKNIVNVPQLAWHGPRDLELSFPDSWKVEVCNIAGYNRPAMKPEQIKAAAADPIGMPPLREYAQYSFVYSPFKQ